jgi:penicillin-binding protein 1B
MPRKRRKSRRRGASRGRFTRLLSIAAVSLLLLAGAGYLYLLQLGARIAAEFEARRWDVPAQVYAAPLELYAGRPLALADLTAELRRLGYRELPSGATPTDSGQYSVNGDRVAIAIRAFSHAGRDTPAQRLNVTFSGRRIVAVTSPDGSAVALARLEPMLIGSLFPAHGEDRIILTPDQIPSLVIDAVEAVEDRRFRQHHGVDLRAIVRAALVNVSAGEIRQGASTLTQQLVRSYFLHNERTFHRKLREALMAAALEQRYSKDELMHAYLNEVYLGQDGSRAIHGFGLASQFHFGKPLGELDLHEIALLIAKLRGPAYYDPGRHPDRTLQRRNLVLSLMVDQGLTDIESMTAAAARPLDVLPPAGRSASYYAAYLNLVRRQLSRDYPADDLARDGLKIYTVMDPAIQSAGQRALVDGLGELQPGGGMASAAVDGAVVVTRPHSGEVLALVGGRRAGFEGFNRALDARRPIGSLVKPFVFLAALQSGDFTLADIVDDQPLELPLANGDVWSPRNFSGESQGEVTLLRALAESLNQATVDLGLRVGLEPVVALLRQLGLQRTIPLYPSLLLGAIELTPVETAELYNTLANGGFHAPLRTVESVVDGNGRVLQRYRLQITASADAAAVYQLNAAMVEVMHRGTGRTVQRRLPGALRVAGKTGTSDGLRDSWFAGFSADYSAVAWVGADDNSETGLTGATGAGVIWARLMTELAPRSYQPGLPPELTQAWVDYYAGHPVAATCDAAVSVPVPITAAIPSARGCDAEQPRGLGGRIRQWLRGTSD